MNIRIPIGYKFILGFIAVVAAAAFIPDIIEHFDIPDWTRKPISMLAAMVVGLFLGSFFTKSFTKRFRYIADLAQMISSGDLTHANQNSRLRRGLFLDETSDLEESLETMTDNLRGLVERLKETVENLAASQDSLASIVTKGEETSKDVSDGASAIFDGALQQSNHIGNASQAVKNMAEIADEVGGKVTENANASQKVNSMVQRGATTATSAMEKMETIFKGIENTETVAGRLREKLSDIPKILDVITHISRQTDLLALNATIEASKAGEHGRGFAMVAEEVRRFADNTNASVQDVSLIVKELRLEVERVVQSASEGTSNLRGGRDDLRKIREILVDITNYTADVAERGTIILTLTQKQKEKAEKIVEAIEEVSSIAHDNLTNTERVETAIAAHGAAINQTIEASHKLTELASELKTVADRFTL
ncbi:MAG: methyl-accepting chemotaxis protein [Deltaproteobacteria bacterium]|nr:methyl-accepting chemotaxis protein [Deltaproteobacteria bacterium]